MKKAILILASIMLTLLCAAALADVDIAATFPDEIFREIIQKNFDTDQNGSLSEQEIEKVTAISCSDQSIQSLKGIEVFPYLKGLYCSKNKLKELDVSHNTSLTHLHCDHNKLTKLDVTYNTALVSLEFHSNQITDIDVSHNTELTNLDTENNKQTALDVSNNPKLEILYCRVNQIETLDVSRNPKLETLFCDGNRLKTLDISNNPELQSLNCNENQLKTLDVSVNKMLKSLKCGGNQLSSLNLSNNSRLTNLECSGNNLTALDISKCSALERLHCQQNKLLTLDVTNCQDLCELVRESKRVTESSFDHFGNYDLNIDQPVTVIAGDIISKPTTEPEEATIDGLNYKLDNKKKTAVFTGPEDKGASSISIPGTIKVNGKKYKVTEIKASACKDMKSLTKLTIGKNVSKIGKKAFSGCKGLKSIKIQTKKLTNDSVGSNAFKTGNKKSTVKCPSGMKDDYADLLKDKGMYKKTKYK